MKMCANIMCDLVVLRRFSYKTVIKDDIQYYRDIMAAGTSVSDPHNSFISSASC